MATDLDLKTRDANRDPITGAPGSHPVGTGLGAAAGGIAAGAAAGTVAGPVGTIVGAVAGAVVGGLMGKGVAEMIDPTAEDAYWKENFRDRPYAVDSTYDEFGPAYRYGCSSTKFARASTASFFSFSSPLRSCPLWPSRWSLAPT